MVDLRWCCVKAGWSLNFFLHLMHTKGQLDMAKSRVCIVVAPSCGPNAGCQMRQIGYDFQSSGALSIAEFLLGVALFSWPLRCAVVGRCVWCVGLAACCLHHSLASWVFEMGKFDWENVFWSMPMSALLTKNRFQAIICCLSYMLIMLSEGNITPRFCLKKNRHDYAIVVC